MGSGQSGFLATACRSPSKKKPPWSLEKSQGGVNCSTHSVHRPKTSRGSVGKVGGRCGECKTSWKQTVLCVRGEKRSPGITNLKRISVLRQADSRKSPGNHSQVADPACCSLSCRDRLPLDIDRWGRFVKLTTILRADLSGRSVPRELAPRDRSSAGGTLLSGIQLKRASGFE